MNMQAVGQLPHEKLPFSTMGCGELNLPGVLSLATERRLAAVELRILSGGRDLLNHFIDRFGTPSALAATIAASRIAVASIDTSISAIGASAEDGALLLRLAPWAMAVGARRLRIFDRGTLGDDAELAEAASLIDWFKAEKAERGWQLDIIVETHDGRAQLDCLQRFLEIAPTAQILWDTYHTWNDGGEGPHTIKRLRERSSYLHVKDSRIGSNGERHHVLPGQGNYPFAELLACLQATDYDGRVSLEWEALVPATASNQRSARRFPASVPATGVA